jgi:curved DNA-binding protein CbpA
VKPAKKSLYELLKVPQNASTEDIQAAHARQLAALMAEQGTADIDFRMQVLKLALTTLTSPSSRLAYDAKLALDKAEQDTLVTNAEATRPGPGMPDGWESRLPPEAEALVRKARRAADPDEERQSPGVWLLANLKSSVTKSLVFIGLLAVMGMVLQMVFMRSALRNSPDELQRTAEDRAVIQEYYQTHGVRPASREEAELLSSENRRKETEAREAEQQQRKVEQERLDFERETRRRADEVSAALRRSEEEALQRALQKP